jgi:hypothetical protein
MPLAGPLGPPDLNQLPAVPAPPPPPTAEQVIDDQNYVVDTFINKTAMNPQTYAQDFQLLQAYAAGSRVTVGSYFLLSTPNGSIQRADAIDPSTLRSSVQTSYTEIRNLELVIQDRGLQSTFNGDTAETRITGAALLYPGMHPRNGDLFVMPIGDNTFGIFQVTGADRLTYRQGSNHKITFFLREYASPDFMATIRRSVTKTVWFDKITYLGDATTLLNEDSYNCLSDLRQLRKILIRHYYNTFYDKEMDSIIARNGSFDPYLVTFLNGNISIVESIYRPVQLYPAVENYENSLWSRFTETTNQTLVGLQSQCNYQQFGATRFDISITSLINRVVVTLENPNRQQLSAIVPVPDYSVALPVGPGLQDSLVPVTTNQPYVLSQNFYAGDKTAMTPFEFLIYAVIQTRQIANLRDFIDGYLKRYTDLSYDERFYIIPIYLWLIDVGIDGIAATNTLLA